MPRYDAQHIVRCRSSLMATVFECPLLFTKGAAQKEEGRAVYPEEEAKGQAAGYGMECVFHKLCLPSPARIMHACPHHTLHAER